MPTLHFNEHASPACTELGDGTRVYRTCSAGIGCHNLGCGLKVHVRDGRLVKVEGDEENPISKGRLCVRCLTAKEYSTTRTGSSIRSSVPARTGAATSGSA